MRVNDVVAVENVALRRNECPQRCTSCSFFYVVVKVKVIMTFNYIVKIRAKDAVILLFSKAINSFD